MNHTRLVWAALLRHKTRTAFTFLSVVIAFIIFGILAAVHYGVSGPLTLASAERLDTFNRGLGTLPLSYYDKIAGVPGVVAVVYGSGFAGYYQNAKNTVAVAFMNGSEFFKVYREYSLPPAELRAYLADRMGIIAGPLLTKNMGWKVGETIPIEGGPLQQNGSTTWYFHLDGIYQTTLPPDFRIELAGHYQYFNESLPAEFRNKVQVFTERVDDPRNATRIASAIDTLYADSSPQTLTQSESEEALAAIRQFGDVTALLMYVGIAVFFVLLLIIGNTLTQSVRERTAEFALLRALGFRRLWIVSLVFRESLSILVCGAVVGLGIGWLVVRALYSSIEGLLQTFQLTWLAVGSGVALAILFGIFAAVLPLPRIVGMKVANELRSN